MYMGLIRERGTNRLPRELEKRSKRLQNQLAAPGMVERIMANAPKQRATRLKELAEQASLQQDTPDVPARVSVATPIVKLLRRFRYEQAVEAADLFLALETDEATWRESVKAAVRTLQMLLQEAKIDQEEELYHYGIKEIELPQLEADVQALVDLYL